MTFAQQKKIAKFTADKEARRAEAQRFRRQQKLTPEELFARKSKMLYNRIAEKQEIRKILNDSAFAKFEKMKRHHDDQRKGGKNHKKPHGNKDCD